MGWPLIGASRTQIQGLPHTVVATNFGKASKLACWEERLEHSCKGTGQKLRNPESSILFGAPALPGPEMVAAARMAELCA